MTVNAVPADRYLMFVCDTLAAVPPFDADLELKAAFAFAEPPVFTYTGPGTAEISPGADEGGYNMGITAEGLYFVTAEVRDDENNIHTDIFAVEGVDRPELDSLLSAKWHDARESLARNDIDRAVGHFAGKIRDASREIFAELSEELLSQMAQDMTNIQFIKMGDNSVEYDLRKTADGKVYSYYLKFVKDEDGLWKIRGF